MSNNYTWRTFPNIGFIHTKFTDEELKPIRENIDEIKLNFLSKNNIGYNDSLAGNIRKEFLLSEESKKHLQKLILPYVNSFNHEFHYAEEIIHFVPGETLPLKLGTCWVNFQEKTEFNPTHTHSGLYSFVIYINVPYTLEEVLQLSPGIKSSRNLAGRFEFLFSNTLGKIKSYDIPVDKTFENTMILFPSLLPHAVYPFYGIDGYRISVSGNFFYQTNNQSKELSND